MNAFLLLTGSGALTILTSHASAEDAALLRKLEAKGIDKFLSYRIPFDLVRERYGIHFDQVIGDLGATDDLRVLDYNGDRAFRRFSFKELGTPTLHESHRTSFRS